MTGGPLAHLSVVALCDDLPGAFCARQFAAWGADVLLAEPPGGSPLRTREPIVSDSDGAPVSLLWEYVAANTRSARFDPADASNGQRLRAAVAAADIFVTDWPEQRRAMLGLTCATLAQDAPRLITVALSPFGSDGPYADYAASDLVVQALSGMLSLSGRPGEPPLKLPANLLPYACGVSAFVAALAALSQRRTADTGQTVEVACLEAVASLVLFSRAAYLGEPFPRRLGVGTVFLPCADGWVLCSPAVQTVWEALLTALNVPPASVPEEWTTLPGRQGRLAEIAAFLAPHSRARNAADLFAALGALQIVCGLLQTPADLPRNPHLIARSCFATLDHPTLGPLPFPRLPGHMSATPPLDPTPAPARPPAGQPFATGGKEISAKRFPAGGAGGTGSPQESVADFEGSGKGTSKKRASASKQGGLGGPGPTQESVADFQIKGPAPLAGVRVLDLTGAWIGPYAAMLLADLGADVIKIESPRRPDVWRIYRPTPSGRPELPPGANPRAHPWNTSFYYNAVNRNKHGLALDLANEQGRALFRALVCQADVLMENFTPRVMENFGLGYDALRRLRPDLIMASFSGYGASGPYRDFKANGATIEAVSGWTALFGPPDAAPQSFGEMEADPLSGLQMAAHTLVALEHRARTGEGQRIDGSMVEAAVGYIGEEIMLAALAPDGDAPKGNRARGLLQGVYPCAGDDAWIAISVRDDADWRALLAVAGDVTDLEDARYASAAGRQSAADAIDALLAEWTRGQEPRALMAALQDAGVPAGVVLKTNEALHDPHFLARGWFRALPHPDLGERLYNGYPWRFSRTEMVWRWPPPRVGEHSAALLHELLDVTDGEYAALERAGVTRCVSEWPEDAAADG